MTSILLIAALTVATPQNGAVLQAHKPVRLSWSGSPDAVYLVNLRRAGEDDALSIAVSNRTDIYVSNPEIGTRYEWSVRKAGSLDEAAAYFVTDPNPPRQIVAKGVRGFRDMGGGRTSDGRRVRQNLLFRACALRSVHGNGDQHISESDVAALQSEFNIRTDVDLRSSGNGGVSALGEKVRMRSIPFACGRRIDHAVRGREPFVRVFDILSDRQNLPVVFETSDDGREADTVAFLLNGLLGVREDDLRRCWTSSQELFAELCDYLKTMPGDTLEKRIEAYAVGCGIKSEEIEAFRTMMMDARSAKGSKE